MLNPHQHRRWKWLLGGALILAGLSLTPSVYSEEPTSSSSATVVSPSTAPVAAPTPSLTPAPSVDISTGDAVISEILFDGNMLNKSRALEKKIKSRVKKPLDKKQLKDDVKILFETGDFDDVRVDVAYPGPKDSKGRRLARVTFHVVERPIIKRIDYKGDRKIKSSSFSEKLQSQEGSPFDRYKAAVDEKTILEYYRDEGYASARVESYTTVDERSKKLILTFFIVEGERVTVKEVRITGSKRYSEKSLQKKMKTRRKKVFKDVTLNEDIEKLKGFYKNHGHLDVSISSPSVSIDEERNEAVISLSVDEGPHYTIGSISIASSTIFTPKELQKAVTLKSGKEFTQTKLDETISTITGLYADKGYLRTEVTANPERDRERGVVNFSINIEESTIVYVDGVYVDGNTYTKTHVIKREVVLKQGDIFSASKMRRSVEKIYNLGFLDDVQVDIQQPKSPDLADLIFTVKEGKPGVLSAGAGFSSVDRFVGTLQVSHTNLFGLGQRVNVQYEFGARRQDFDIGWTDPWFLGYNMSGGLDLYNTLRVRDYPGVTSAFQEKRRGVSFRLGPRITDDLSLLFGYTVESDEIFGVDQSIKKELFPTFGIAPENADEVDTIHQMKSSFLSELSYDNRDNRFDATHGGKHSLSVEVAGGPFGGDINYYQPQVSSAYYIPTFWKFVLSLSARASWVNSFAPSKDVPTSERFFLGGADTIRGYDTNSIAPRQVSIGPYGVEEVHSIPGRIMTLMNAEYKFPIVQEHNRTIFQGAFFLDVGGSWLRTQDISLTTGRLDSRMKAGAGFGFRFKTPVFPIRLDFGIPLNPRKTDITRQGDSHSLQPYFTIGNIF